MGQRWAGVLAGEEKVNLKVIIDQDEEKAKKLAEKYNVSAGSDLISIIKDPLIDAAVVALPHKFLASTSLQFLKNGKQVLCEKPGARTAAELTSAIKAASQNNCRFMVGFNHRFHESHEKAKEFLKQGIIGDLLFMRAHYGFGGRPGYDKEWRHNKELGGGGELIDQGIHLIDLARWFLGDIVKVCGFTQNAFWKSAVEDNAFVLLKDQQGRVASLHASWSQWKPSYLLELFGTKGYLIIEGLGKKYGGKERLYIGKRSADFGVEKEEVIECDTNADNSLRKELAEFISSLKEFREPSPSANDALEALKIVEEIYRAQK